jgi:WhiB family redox-sensing transcriptional regulator
VRNASLAEDYVESAFRWQDFAACLGINPDLFFPPPHYETPIQVRAREAKAKAICNTCPVRQPCLDFALRTDQFGIWGGTNSQERDRLRGKKPRRNRK